MQTKKRIEELCLDFANTLDWHASLHPVEKLHHYRDLIAWCYRQDILTDKEAKSLEDLSGRMPEKAERVYRHSIAIREAIYQVIVAHVHGKKIDEAHLAILNAAIKSASSHLYIHLDGQTYVWGWLPDNNGLDRPLWPIVQSIASLLTTPYLLNRAGQCADERGCGWLFLDMSKNHSRRWCDIKDCGNRAKQRRHYQRKRAG